MRGVGSKSLREEAAKTQAKSKNAVERAASHKGEGKSGKVRAADEGSRKRRTSGLRRSIADEPSQQLFAELEEHVSSNSTVGFAASIISSFSELWSTSSTMSFGSRVLEKLREIPAKVVALKPTLRVYVRNAARMAVLVCSKIFGFLYLVRLPGLTILVLFLFAAWLDFRTFEAASLKNFIDNELRSAPVVGHWIYKPRQIYNGSEDVARVFDPNALLDDVLKKNHDMIVLCETLRRGTMVISEASLNVRWSDLQRKRELVAMYDGLRHDIIFATTALHDFFFWQDFFLERASFSLQQFADSWRRYYEWREGANFITRWRQNGFEERKVSDEYLRHMDSIKRKIALQKKETESEIVKLRKLDTRFEEIEMLRSKIRTAMDNQEGNEDNTLVWLLGPFKWLGQKHSDEKCEKDRKLDEQLDRVDGLKDLHQPACSYFEETVENLENLEQEIERQKNAINWQI